MEDWLPSYRAVFEREGVHGPGEVALVGSAQAVEDGLCVLAEAGVSDFAAAEFGLNQEERAATRALLSTVAAR